MKLIQVSPRQLICEDDTYCQRVVPWRILSIFMGIMILFVNIFEADITPRRPAYMMTFEILVLYFALSSAFACMSRQTATIDLDLECIEIKEYWPLFRKCKIRQYQIGLITHIEVQLNHNDNYRVMWQRHNMCAVAFGSGYTEDRSRAEADAEIIRSFLNQDGRDIEIG